MALFKTPKDWFAFVTSKKFVRSDNAAIYQFINPMINGGFNLKVLWKGKMTNTKAEFHTMGSSILKIDEELFTITAVNIGNRVPQLTDKDTIQTMHKGKEVMFQRI